MVIGFWKRLLSDFLDSIFLGIFGLIIIFPLKVLLGGHNENALWVGLIVSFLYGGLLQSYMGEGQSLAKRLLKIQVLGLDGKYLSLSRSFLRYTIIDLLFYNGVFGSIIGLLFNSPLLNTFFVCSVVILFFGCVLMVPIHPLKRGIHDIIAGSIVVRKGTYKKALVKLKKKQKTRVKWAYGSWAAASFLTFVITGIMAGRMWNNPNSFLKNATDLSQAVEANTDYQNVQVSINVFTNRPFSGRSTSVKRLIVSGFLPDSINDDPGDKETNVKKAVSQVLAHYPRLNEVDRISIVTRTGFSIGIANLNKNTSEEFWTNGVRFSP